MEQSVSELMSDLSVSLDSGDEADGRGPPVAPEFGQPIPSPIMGTSWENNINAMSLFTHRKPTKEMKTLPWTKVYPDLSGR